MSLSPLLPTETGEYDPRQTELAIAAGNGNMEKILSLIDRGVDIHYARGWALRVAASNGQFEVVKFFVENGVDVHSLGEQPFLMAVFGGYDEIVKFLLEKGADINISIETTKRDGYASDGRNALSWALDGGHPKTASLLIREGINYDMNVVKKIIGTKYGVNINPTLEEDLINILEILSIHQE
jgi:ankyrin repeat protein